MKKLNALKNTGIVINETIELLKTKITTIERSVVEPTSVESLSKTMRYIGNNGETSYFIYSCPKGQKTKTLLENEFKRIICLEGKIKINMPQFNEEIIITSLNTILIPPNTKHTIEIIDDAEMIKVFKPRKKSLSKNLLKKTIYKTEHKTHSSF